MFAGAAREAVFSNPDVIRRVNDAFIPVALKAALVNNPPDDEEGLLYREIGRSKIVPQGICVVNPAGRVLAWTVTFDDDKSVLAFFDHALQLHSKNPDARKPVLAVRYMRYPSRQLDNVMDSGVALKIPERHSKGRHCPATPPLPDGALEIRLVGRALDKDGRPVADTLRQEHYVEDRFILHAATQKRLANVLAGAERVRLPEEVVRPFVMHSYLGMLDVQPISNPGRTKGELRKCEFWAQPLEGHKGTWRIDGTSETFNGAGMANAGPSDMHDVRLTWHGFVQLKGDRVSSLILSAQGAERLKFGTARGRVDNEVAFLPAGRRIDLDCAVRYGLTGEAMNIDPLDRKPR